jgi:two-component system phosphate regulon response regulator OmpR
MVAHILVIENEERVSEAICDHLADQGYRCTSATTLEEARLVLSRFQIDLLIVGSELPGGADGLELAREARASGLPAMMIAPSSSAPIAGEGIPVLVKPLRLDRLLEAIEVLIDPSARSPKTA